MAPPKAAKDKKEKKGSPSRILSLDGFAEKYRSSVVDVKGDVRKMKLSGGYRTTGSLAVDSLLNGGFPMGSMVELWGPPQSGKSTLATACAGQVLQAGGTVGYWDLERGLDLVNEADFLTDLEDNTLAARLKAATDEERKAHSAHRSSWLRMNGVDVFNEKFHILDPMHGEEMFSMLADVVSNNLMDLCIVDSVAAIITRAEMDGQPGESHFGQVAKLLSVELKRLMRLYSGNRNTTIIFINQARDKIGYMAKGQKSTGGHALEHFVGTKIRFNKIRREETKDDVITESAVKVDKSRYASARTINIYVSGRRGLDVLKELLDFGVEHQYVHTSGAWYYFFDAPVTAEVVADKKDRSKIPGFLAKQQGEEAALNWMVENGWKERMKDLAKATHVS